jgi:uncharacterized protein DUF4054
VITPASFRQQFPAFADVDVYDDIQITLFIGVAGNLLDANRWDTLLDYGTALFVAHHLVLAARDEATVAVGGIAGAVQGILTAKAVDKVSASYDASSVSLEDGNFWNMTRYGIEFLRYARQFGAGGFQLGTNVVAASGDGFGGSFGGF